MEYTKKYKATIQSISDDPFATEDPEGFYKVQIDREETPLILNAHQNFFRIDPKELLGKKTAIMTDSQQNIIKIFLEDGGLVYKHNENDYQETKALIESNQIEIQKMFYSKAAEAKARQYKARLAKGLMIEADCKKQQKYDELRHLLGSGTQKSF